MKGKMFEGLGSMCHLCVISLDESTTGYQPMQNNFVAERMRGEKIRRGDRPADPVRHPTCWSLTFVS